MKNTQQNNQSLLPMLKMETSQHKPYELESPSSMSTNQLAMPQYKPSKVTILQDKSKSITEERAMPQNKTVDPTFPLNAFPTRWQARFLFEILIFIYCLRK